MTAAKQDWLHGKQASHPRPRPHPTRFHFSKLRARLVLVLCLLLNLGSWISPFSNVHAHLERGDHTEHVDEHTPVHGGHVHDFDHHGVLDGEEPGPVVYLDGAALHQDAGSIRSIEGPPLLYAFALAALIAPLQCQRLRPPPNEARRPSQYPPWPPPLRGPPMFI